MGSNRAGNPRPWGKRILVLAAAGWSLAGCAGLRTAPHGVARQVSPEEAVRTAEYFLEHRPSQRIDCSHFILGCYHSPGLAAYLNRKHPGRNLTWDLNEYLEIHKTRRARVEDIQPGDILIFDKTYDINRDGHIDEKDLCTHAGIVEKAGGGVVEYIDASEGRNPPRIRRRKIGFYGEKFNETVAVDPATGKRIHVRETFHAAYAAP